MIYLDNASTTKPKLEVVAAVMNCHEPGAVQTTGACSAGSRDQKSSPRCGQGCAPLNKRRLEGGVLPAL